MGLIPLPTHTLYPPYMPPASLSPPHKPYVIPEVNKRVPEEKKQSDRGGENRTTILKISLAPTTTAGAGPTLHVRRTPSRTASLVLPGGLPQDLNGNRRLMNHLVARLQSKTSPEGAASMPHHHHQQQQHHYQQQHHHCAHLWGISSIFRRFA